MSWLIAALLLAQGPGSSPADAAEPKGRLSAADLPAYLEALGESEAAKTSESDPPAASSVLSPTFKELWDRPETFRDRAIRVQGRIARRFHQQAVGDFPPLVELWLLDSARNPYCVVYPEPRAQGESEPSIAIGETVAFDGRFLRMLSYPGGDSERLVPLIVGSRLPSLANAGTGASGAAQAARGAFRGLDWLVAIALAAAVGFALLSLHLRRPQPRSRSAVSSSLESELIFADQPERAEGVVA